MDSQDEERQSWWANYLAEEAEQIRRERAMRGGYG
jgi:hypothetical protein